MIIIHRKLWKIFFPSVASYITTVQHQNQETDIGTSYGVYSSVSCVLVCGRGGCIFAIFSCVDLCKPPPQNCSFTTKILVLIGETELNKISFQARKSLHKDKWKRKKKLLLNQNEICLTGSLLRDCNDRKKSQPRICSWADATRCMNAFKWNSN